MQYEINGPYEIPRTAQGLVDRAAQSLGRFWQDVDASSADLHLACGCYIFGLRAAKGIVPWYVGMAEKQAFQDECLKSHQVNIYNDVLSAHNGTPLLFLIAKTTPQTGRYARPTVNHHPDISFLETLTIGAALEKNPELMNIQKTAMLRNLIVPGLINTPRRRPTRAEEQFRKALE